MVRWTLCSFVSLALFLSGCSVGIQGSGVSKTETREVGSFESVSHDFVGEVLVRQGEDRSVVVTADDNLLPVIETAVDEGVLVIKTKESFSSSVGIRVEVTAPKLTSLTVKGVGSLQAEGLDAESLTVDLSGVGSLKASGKVKQVTANLSGVGGADLQELIADSVTVSVSGVGGAKVHATQSVEAKTSGVGGVVVTGEPADRKTETSGIGSVEFK
jgi:hypothetical protein